MGQGRAVTIEVKQALRGGEDWDVHFQIRGDHPDISVIVSVPHTVPLEQAIPKARAKLHRLLLALAKETMPWGDLG